jgi:putative pyruvate formate lyase activating enzyme
MTKGAPTRRPQQAQGIMIGSFSPAYRRLMETGALAERVRTAREHLRDCDLCGHHCRVDRTTGSRGAICRTGERAVVHSYGPYHGEESCLRGRNGSGAIFFASCNLRCDFCQNWDASQKSLGETVTTEELAAMMLRLQDMGCHNINLVSPSHVVASILAAVEQAAEQGLTLPLVYNSGGFDSAEALALLDGVIDIYMPDMKYTDSALARTYSHIDDYAETNRNAVREMHRQVGLLTIGEDGLARRGLLIRHLVLPGDVAGTADIAYFIAQEIAPDTYVDLTDRYHPCYRAERHPEIARPTTAVEYAAACEAARRAGLTRFDCRI